MPSITPCLWFRDQALPAAELYVSVFPRSRIISTLPYPDGAPGEPASIMLVTFELDGQRLQALNGGPAHGLTEAISLVVPLDTQAEIDEVWAALTADGGEPGRCGWLKDRYGLSWQVVPSTLDELAAEPERYSRAMGALLEMTKIDVAALYAAADGT